MTATRILNSTCSSAKGPVGALAPALWLLAVLAAMFLLLASLESLDAQSTSSPLQTAASRTRTYYIAADEVDWDYAPGGINKMMGMKFEGYSKVFTERGPHRIGTVYRKALYREYTDDTFTHLKPRSPEWQHTGLLGPILRAEVGDTIKIVFKNNATRPYSMHPHGVFYNKDSEGAPYDDGTSGTDKEDDAVPPGKTHLYTWEVPERAGPGPNDPSSIVWLYHSHTNELKDVESGLIGAMIITRRGMADADGKPKDVDREFVCLYLLFDENVSWYLDHNIQTFTTDPKGVKKLEFAPGRQRRQLLRCRIGIHRRQRQVRHQRLHLRHRPDDDDEERRARPLVSGRTRRAVQRPHAALARQRRIARRQAYRCRASHAGANGDRGHGSRQSRASGCSIATSTTTWMREWSRCTRSNRRARSP